MKEAFGFPVNAGSGPPAPFGSGQSLSPPSIPVISSMAPVATAAPVASAASAGATAIPTIQVLNDSDSDPDVQSLTIPFRSGSSSENFLPMISTDDAWFSDQEFRFVITIDF